AVDVLVVDGRRPRLPGDRRAGARGRRDDGARHGVAGRPVGQRGTDRARHRRRASRCGSDRCGAAGARAGMTEVDAVFAALSDPTRRLVLDEVGRRGGATATELAADLPVTRQAVAKHLAVLAGARLVDARRAGRETRYRVT